MVTTCSICGTTEAVDPGEFSKCLLRDIMEERKCCFHCAFWINHLGLYKNDPKWLVINGASWIVYILTYPLLRENPVSLDVEEEK